jgi:hypothetical protein
MTNRIATILCALHLLAAFTGCPGEPESKQQTSNSAVQVDVLFTDSDGFTVKRFSDGSSGFKYYVTPSGHVDASYTQDDGDGNSHVVVERIDTAEAPVTQEMRAVKTPDREYPCEVREILDGDTVRISLALGFDLTLTDSARLYGLDCPELPTPEGQAAKAFTEQWLARHKGFAFTAHGKGRDKYHRLLGTIIGDGESLNAALLESGHARVY